jgi:hypothetical protein
MEKVNNEGMIDEDEEINKKEYLGTFRWKKSLTFPKLTKPLEDFNFMKFSKWSEYFESRVDLNFQFEPHIIDALSYPLSIIYGIEKLKEVLNSFTEKFFKERILNIVLIGVSKKTEGRIATESNYFDEVFFYIKQNNPSITSLNLFFVGEEIHSTYSKVQDNGLNYCFFKGITGDFLKSFALEFSKSNTVIIGMNCGFGAGYIKLTCSWIRDLVKLLKFSYPLIFTCTNDYEDFKGELGILENLLGANIFLKLLDNPFKSMTTYKNDEGLWSCGNNSLYITQGEVKGSKKLTQVSKLKDGELKDGIEKCLLEAGITLK